MAASAPKTKKNIPNEIWDKVSKHFDGDKQKVWKWFCQPNAYLNMQTPLQMLKNNQANAIVKKALCNLPHYS
jgi:Protein of unknown function (DUF2384)